MANRFGMSTFEMRQLFLFVWVDNQIHGRSGWKEQFWCLRFYKVYLKSRVAFCCSGRVLLQTKKKQENKNAFWNKITFDKICFRNRRLNKPRTFCHLERLKFRNQFFQVLKFLVSGERLKIEPSCLAEHLNILYSVLALNTIEKFKIGSWFSFRIYFIRFDLSLRTYSSPLK